MNKFKSFSIGLAAAMVGLILGISTATLAGFNETSGDFTETVKRVKTQNAMPSATFLVASGGTAQTDSLAAFTAGAIPSFVTDANLSSSCLITISAPSTSVSTGPTPAGGGGIGITFTIQQSIDNGTAWYTLGTAIAVTATGTLDSLYVLTNFGNMIRVKGVLAASAVPAVTAGTFTASRGDVLIKYAAIH